MNPMLPPIPSDFHAITPAEWELHVKDDLWMPMCTALTRKNTWCKNPIFHGQIYTWWGDTPIITLSDWAFVEAGVCGLHWRRLPIDEQARSLRRSTGG